MKQSYDVVIIGGGPAGLSAAIYTARDLRSTLVIESGILGGMMALTSKVDNYPGTKLGIGGFELAKAMTDQAKACGAEILYDRVIDLVKTADGLFQVKTNKQTVQAKVVLLATGTTHRKLGIPGEAEMIGRGVHFCATCDGALYKDRDIAVIGGGNSAVEETIFLTKFARKIYLISLTELTASQTLKQELSPFIQSGQVEVYIQASTRAITYQDDQSRVNGVVIKKGDDLLTLPVDGVFIFIGLVPQADYLSNLDLEQDKGGFILANQNRTAVSGLFVAGDIVAGVDRQIAVAVGDGVKAALKILQYLA